jgi:hypothetical protein
LSASLPPAAAPPDVPRVPAPWVLHGNGWIVLLRLPGGSPARMAGVPPALQSSLRAAFSALACVEYVSAPCGSYRELLLIPGTMQFPDGRRYASIGRILVSTWASVVNGRANWGIAKDRADTFEISRDAATERFRVVDGGREVCRLDFEAPRGPRLPMRTSWLPAGWGTLAQLHEQRAYYYRPTARGSLRPVRLVQARYDGTLFPDLSSATVLAAFRVESFAMEFPVARVEEVPAMASRAQ